MKIFLGSLLLASSFFTVNALAKFGLPPVDLKPGQFVEGSLFSVKYVPGDKSISFYIVGQKRAGIQFIPKQTILEMNGQKFSLEQNSSSKAFVYPRPAKAGAILKVEKNDGETEEFHLTNP